MATNLSIDPDLIERALEVSGERTKKAAVTKALLEFVARRQQKYWSLWAGSNGTRGSTTRLSGSAVEPVRRHERMVACPTAGRPATFGTRVGACPGA
jgi:Arc/MetJ family transcription regulator